MEFLNYIKAEKYPCTSQILFFSCSEIPSYFIYNFVKRLQQERKHSVLFLDLAIISLDQAKQDVNMFFLSGPVIYFIKNFYNLTSEQKKDMRNFLSNYEGPNYLFVFDIKVSDENSIQIEDKVTLESYSKLFKFFYPKLIPNELFTKKLFSLNKQYPIDIACVLMSYEPVLGRNSDYFFNNWFNKIVGIDKSLFKLSQYFFAQDALFFEQWNILKLEYPIEFWLAFWSDRIFRAFGFVFYQQQGNSEKAHKEAKFLPFSFINKDWQAYTLVFLSNAHEFLLNLDFNIKNGTGDINLELWYLKFVFKKF